MFKPEKNGFCDEYQRNGSICELIFRDFIGSTKTEDLQVSSQD